MASITMDTVSTSNRLPSDLVGDEKFLAINSAGKPVTISVSQILDRLDDQIIGDELLQQIEDNVTDKIEDQIDDIIDDRLDDIDHDCNLKWNEVT